MFRRRRTVAAVLVVAIVISLVAGVSRLLGGSSVGVVDAAAATATAGGANATSAQSTAGASAGSTTAGTGQTSKPAKASTTATATPKRPDTAVPAGNGKFTAFAVPAADTPGAGRVVTYTVEVEQGLRADGKALAAAAQAVLKSPRGWQRADSVRFVHLTPAQVKAGKKPDVVVSFASPSTVDKLCVPLATQGKTSCASTPRAVLNYWRWINGVEYFGTDITGYRQYMINHEVGHLLGHLHEKCPGKGKVSPVMSQQTLGLDGCTPNAWPATPAKA